MSEQALKNSANGQPNDDKLMILCFELKCFYKLTKKIFDSFIQRSI